jgi:glycosyltransferase involved in cell wall biosynthesis
VKILVTNTGHPELDRLAENAARRGLLGAYVRPWVYRGDHPLPPLPRQVSDLLTKRARPDLAGIDVDFAGSLVDVAAVLAGRFGLDGVQQLCERGRRAQVDAAGARRITERDRPDVVYANFGGALQTFTRARRRGVPTVLSYPTVHHDVAERIGRELARTEPALAGTIDFHGLPRALRQRLSAEIELADRVLVASDYAARTFMDAGVPADRLVVTRFGIEPPRSPLTERPAREAGAPLSVGFCGQVGARKGFHVALRAVKELGPDRARLKVAGRYVGDRDVWASFGVAYDYAGNLDRAGLAVFYQDIDVLVLPTYFEGLPLGMLDALAYGVPAVVTDRGPAEAVRDGVEGYVVPVGDHRALADALDRIAQDPDLLYDMSKAALARAGDFTWGRYADVALASFTPPGGGAA